MPRGASSWPSNTTRCWAIGRPRSSCSRTPGGSIRSRGKWPTRSGDFEYRKVNDQWIEAPRSSGDAATDPGAGERTAAAGSATAFRGLTPQEVRVRLGGKPDRVSYIASQGQLVEQWIYRLPDQDQYVNFLHATGDPLPKVVAYYARPRSRTDAARPRLIMPTQPELPRLCLDGISPPLLPVDLPRCAILFSIFSRFFGIPFDVSCLRSCRNPVRDLGGIRKNRSIPANLCDAATYYRGGRKKSAMDLAHGA